jgi:hypothetical protein
MQEVRPMFDHKARNGGFGGLAAVTVLAVVLAGCSADASAARLGGGISPKAVQLRLEGDPYQAGTRAPAKAGATAKQTLPAIQLGRTGTHPGGGGPQK